jgi:hypothetical protein
LRARPEQTQLEDLSDASFLGKLLALPANLRLDWKVFARFKHSSLFGLVVSNEEKKFYNIDSRRITRCNLTSSETYEKFGILNDKANTDSPLMINLLLSLPL